MTTTIIMKRAVLLLLSLVACWHGGSYFCDAFPVSPSIVPQQSASPTTKRTAFPSQQHRQKQDRRVAVSLHTSSNNDKSNNEFESNSNNNNMSNNNSNFFESMIEFMNNQFFGSTSNSRNGDSNMNRINYSDDEDTINNNSNNEQQTIVTIPVQEMKMGGLRLFLMFYLMGEQNTPTRNTWRAIQTSSTSSSASNTMGVEYYYCDNTAVLSIVLEPDTIGIYRKTASQSLQQQQPSNSYMMQEAIIVDGILNELQQCATDERIPMKDRLLILHSNNQNVITQAKESLAFG